MKKIIFILTIFTLTTLASFGQAGRWKNVIVQTLDFAYLEGCETGKGPCKPIEIIRQNKEDSIFLCFPSGGTVSDVYLYSIKTKNVLLHDKKLIGEGNPTLNLTNLDDGEYTAAIMSCGLGGSCIVRIKTWLL